MANEYEDIEDLIAQQEAEESGRIVAADKARREAEETKAETTGNELLDAALDLARRGFYVIPCAPCGTPDRNRPDKPGKNPMPGFMWQDPENGATRDESKIRAIWSKWPTANIAIRMGQKTNVYAIDVDQKDGVDGFATLKENGFEMPPTLSDESWSGGRHFYFKWNGEGLPPRQSQDVNGLKGIDVRAISKKDWENGVVGDGGYAIVAPSKLQDPKSKRIGVYRWLTPLDTPLAEFPEWAKLRDDRPKAKKKAKAQTKQDDLPKSGITKEEALERMNRMFAQGQEWLKAISSAADALKARPASVSRAEDERNPDKSLLLAVRLCRETFKLDKQGTWNALNAKPDDATPSWNERCVEADEKTVWKWSRQEVNHAYDTIEDTPSDNFINASATADAGDGDGATQGEESEAENERQINPIMDERLLNPEGLVGKIADYIRRSSIVERPQFALSAALCLSSALLGRKVFDAVSYSGVNLFTLNLLDGGGGKDDCFSAGDRFLYALGNGYEQRVLNGPASGAGLIDLVIERKAGLIAIDEAGEFLARMLESNKPDGNYTQLRKIIKELYSRSKLGSLFKQDQRARTQSGKFLGAVTIRQPSVSLYLTGAPNRIASALSSAEVTDGLIPRFLFFFDEGAKRIDLRHKHEPIPGELLRDLYDAMQQIEALCENDPLHEVRALMLNTTDEALDLFQQFEDEFRLPKDQKRVDGDYACGAWVRCVENARRVAANVACLRIPAKPVIEKYDAEYSIALLKFLCTNSENFIRGKLADDEFFQIVVKVQELFRRKGERKGRQRIISKSDLLRSSKMDVEEFDKVIKFLKETEWLEERREETSTRPRTIYQSTCKVV